MKSRYRDRRGNWLEIPSIFYEIAAVTPGVTADDVKNAVGAALDAVTEQMTEEEAVALQRAILRNIVEDYARTIEMNPDMTSDALIAATQYADDPDEEEGPFGA